ncbi:MAG: hypothetical protein IKA75_00630 [Bacteroidaceae bacterium]|nr:hypothetical protein [Bacteroidaceae bacterium]
MKQMLKLVLLATLLLAVACKESTVEQWLNRAEACMEVDADSAYRCLQYIADAEEWDDEQRARYALLHTQAMHKCHIPLEDDSLINTAVTYYADSRDRHRLALSLLYKGLVHKQCGEVAQAIESFVGSGQAFDGVEDNQYKALLYSHYASLLMKQEMYEGALDYYKKSCQYKLLGDSLHYVVSNCGQIANIYKIMNMPDSAKAYYERGLSYKDSLGDGKERNYYLLLQSYATFLMERGEYAETERLLQECLTNMTDTHYLHTLYAALTTLYYEKREYETALTYGQRVIGSTDSLTVCGGYLRLYKIYKDMGEMDSAFHYHNLYRQYNSDITLRKKTAEVAAIPHKMKVAQLAKENRSLTGWRLWLTVSLAVVVVMAIGIYAIIKRRHRFAQREKERELTETKVNLGQTKGALTHQSHAFDRMRNAMDEMKRKHQTEIKQLKESIRKLEEDIRDLKRNDRTRNHTEAELKQDVKALGKQLEAQNDKLLQLVHQRDIDRRIEHFVAGGYDSVAANLLLQLRLDRQEQFTYEIRTSEHLTLLKVLLQKENPALYTRLMQCEMEDNKRIMCCLIALGLDDVDMMARAACLSPHSVKAYRKECRETLYN